MHGCRMVCANAGGRNRDPEKVCSRCPCNYAVVPAKRSLSTNPKPFTMRQLYLVIGLGLASLANAQESYRKVLAADPFHSNGYFY